MAGEAVTATVHRAWAADLDTRTLYALLRLRVDVFVVEQACPYPELDGRDLEDRAPALLARRRRAPDEPVLGCLRLLKEPDGDYRIGRLCTARAARGRGLGVRLMEAALGEVGDQPCVLDAQAHLAGVLPRLRLRTHRPGLDWDGVPHLPMRRDGR